MRARTQTYTLTKRHTHARAYAYLHCCLFTHHISLCDMQEGEGGDGSGPLQDDVEGTGMGEGSGKRDVGDEIEDEEQLLGLKGDKPPDPEQMLPQDNEGGVEMQVTYPRVTCL